MKAEVDTADYEDETRAAARRLFEAWKRALDATIEVPDREPAINALSSCRGKRVRMREREKERLEKREAEIFGGCEDSACGKGWLCLPVKALGGCAQTTLSKNTPQRKSANVHPTGNRASLLQLWNLEPNHLAMFAFEKEYLFFRGEIKI